MARRLTALVACVVVVVALVACRKSRAECDRACSDAKAAALAASEEAERARLEELTRKEKAEHDAIEEWRLRQEIIHSNLADARRLSAKSTAWLTYVKNARLNVDRFRGLRIAQTPSWIELDALVTSTQHELEAVKPRTPKSVPTSESAIAIRDRCGTGRMFVMVFGWDPCLSPELLICDRGSDEDQTLIELATLGCARIGSDEHSLRMCCPPPP